MAGLIWVLAKLSPPLEFGEVCSITSGPKRVLGSLPGSQPQFGARRNWGRTWERAEAEEIGGILRGQLLGEQGRGFRGPFAAGVAPHGGLGEKTPKTP